MASSCLGKAGSTLGLSLSPLRLAIPVVSRMALFLKSLLHVGRHTLLSADAHVGEWQGLCEVSGELLLHRFGACKHSCEKTSFPSSWQAQTILE